MQALNLQIYLFMIDLYQGQYLRMINPPTAQARPYLGS